MTDNDIRMNAMLGELAAQRNLAWDNLARAAAEIASRDATIRERESRIAELEAKAADLEAELEDKNSAEVHA